MTIKEVLEKLNKGHELEDIAIELGLNVDGLKRKLNNAAIQFNKENNLYQYKGTAEEESLSRDVRKKIVALGVDKPYIVRNDKEGIQTRNTDMEYLMYMDYLKVNPSLLKEKKTFNLSSDLYQTIKALSIEKSLRINVLINILLDKGLEYYKVELKNN